MDIKNDKGASLVQNYIEGESDINTEKNMHIFRPRRFLWAILLKIYG